MIAASVASGARTSVRIVEELSSTAKGAIAESMITAEAVRLGIDVYRPVTEGGRADLVFDFGDRLARVQCKWGRLVGDVIVVRTATCRHSPTRGYVKTTYAEDEIDAFGVYCGELNRCYYVPITDRAGKTDLHLRLRPARNNQRVGVTMAADYQFGAVAQLGERRHGMAEVRGSIPLSST